MPSLLPSPSCLGGVREAVGIDVGFPQRDCYRQGLGEGREAFEIGFHHWEVAYNQFALNSWYVWNTEKEDHAVRDVSLQVTCWFGGGSGRNCVLRNLNGFMSLLKAPGTDYDDDKYTLLVRLILWWVRGCRSGVLVSIFSAGEKAGPRLGQWRPLKTADSEPRIPRHLLLNKGDEQDVSPVDLCPTHACASLGKPEEGSWFLRSGGWAQVWWSERSKFGPFWADLQGNPALWPGCSLQPQGGPWHRWFRRSLQPSDWWLHCCLLLARPGSWRKRSLRRQSSLNRQRRRQLHAGYMAGCPSGMSAQPKQSRWWRRWCREQWPPC